MLDIKLLENDPEFVRTQLSRRGPVEGLDAALELISKRKLAIASLEAKQAERNAASKSLQKASKDEINAKRQALKDLSQSIKDEQYALSELEEKLADRMMRIPNILLKDVPDGADESGNVETSRIGTPKQFDYPVLDHVALGEALDILDFERAAKISGARFAFLKGALSRLNRALASFCLDYHLDKGDVELTPPYMVKEGAMRGTGQFPKFVEDAFEVKNDDSYYLIPTAEVPVTNYHADEILEGDLPRRYFAYSPCFRAEAGSAGKDTRGLIRLHQFEKIEMVRFCHPDAAAAELDEMVGRASELLSKLELPHRLVTLCSGDTGANAEKTVDIEVWIPAQNTYREISSCSTFGTFQARRAKIRHRPVADGGKKAKPELVATLNGSGLPMGRTLVALMENHQNADGSITIPEVLRPYMGGQEVINDQ